MFTRILVPTDFSAPSDVALEYARVMARHFGASLHILNVIDDIELADGFVPDAFIPPAPQWRTERMEQALAQLSQRLTAADRLALRAKTEVIFGKPSQEIVNYAADNAFDLIVMGTHGREGIVHVLMGSVAELVVRTARCPVMTVHEGQMRLARRPGQPIERVSATA